MTEARARLNALPFTYPRLFERGQLWGIEHGDGWSQIIVTLCERLETILQDDPDAKFAVRQVKEKFGGLRFYYSLELAQDETTLLVREAVDLAAAASVNVCEYCGQLGQLRRHNRWLRTQCLSCSANPM